MALHTASAPYSFRTEGDRLLSLSPFLSWANRSECTLPEMEGCQDEGRCDNIDDGSPVSGPSVQQVSIDRTVNHEGGLRTSEQLFSRRLNKDALITMTAPVPATITGHGPGLVETPAANQKKKRKLAAAARRRDNTEVSEGHNPMLSKATNMPQSPAPANQIAASLRPL